MSEHLRANGRHEEAERLSLGQVEGLIGWGALAYAAMRSGQVLAANETRWAHVQVPQALSRRAGVRGGGQTPDMVEMVPSEARAFWKALMDNASALIADAHLLLSAGSYGRGKALTVLAQEELGKALWVYDKFETAWNAGDEQPRAVSRLAKHGTNHVVKYQEAIVFGHELAAFWGDWDAVEVDWSGDAVSRRREQAEAAARAANKQKQRGFYVDRGKDGAVSSPTQVEAATIVEDLQTAAQVVEMLLIRDHSRMKLEAESAYDSTGAQQFRLLPISHPEDWDAASEDFKRHGGGD